MIRIYVDTSTPYVATMCAKAMNKYDKPFISQD